MEPATKPGTAPPPTAVHAGPPPGAANGVLNGTAPASQTATAPRTKPIVVRVLALAADLRITVVLFALAMLVVFWGTLAQVDFSVWTVQLRYFRSFFLWVPLRVVLFNMIEDNGVYLPFPGGWLIGSAMLVNLLAAHAIRFKLAWNRGGIILIHAGIIIMMLGEFVTGMYAIEGSMEIREGTSTNTITHGDTSEFAVIRTIDAKKDEVITVPDVLLRPGSIIDKGLPFRVEIIQYMPNSRLIDRGEIDAKGSARTYTALEQQEIAGVSTNQRHHAPSMYVYLTDRNGEKLGKWLFSAHLVGAQWVRATGADGKPVDYQVRLRLKETQRDFTLHLDKFQHDVFPGTNTPKNFHSYVRLTDEKAGILDAAREIYMNAPMTYKGETFYQQGWTTDPLTRRVDGTVLQVVRNPGWAMPYIACFVVGIGMLYHFGITLYKFVDRRIVR